MKVIKLAFFLLLFQLSLGQVTLKITSLPSNTPADAKIYLAGDFNSWNAVDPAYILQSDGSGNLEITIPEGSGKMEFKFTRGSWPTVEGNASGTFLPNRNFTFTGVPQTINLTILSWEDLGGGTATSTAAANVEILNTAFYMPQLETSRKIWLYLPPDYYTSTKTYPVLYMEDGQNLFDNATSFAGEWQVDETLNKLFNEGDYGAIVVGINNGPERLNEYSPWINSQYNAGGKGDKYMAFVAETLKPYMDSNYRTKSAPEFNALIGSSMGGLISFYGACEFPNQFEKVGALSPSFWFALTDEKNYITNNTNDISKLKMYFVAGQNESSAMVPDINTIKDLLFTKGMTATNINTKFDSYGTHSESYWRGEFGGVYQWLFADVNLANENHKASKFEIKQINNNEIWANGIVGKTSFDLIAITGQKIKNIQITNGKNRLPDNLSLGLYILKTDQCNGYKPLKIMIR